MTTLKKQAVSGIKWLMGSTAIQRVITFATTVVLARILTPATFGLFSLAFIAIDSLGLFSSMGFDSALIRKKDDMDKSANTAFFIIPVLGISLYLLLAISAPLIGKFLNNQEVISVVRALGIIFVIGCFGKVPAALLEKSMQFKKVSFIDISSLVIYSIAAIVFAVFHFGIWSLVIAYILKTLYQNILAWLFSGWTPRFEFDKKIAWEMFHFGKFLFLGSLVGFLKWNLDNLLVGKLLGITALGFYGIAFNVANIGGVFLGSKVYRVAFPAYSKLQGNLYDLRAAALKVLKHLSLLVLPLGVAIFFLSGEFLRLIYGLKWLEAKDVLRILAWSGVFNTLPAGMSAIFLACGKPKLTFLITTLQVTMFFVFITPMAKIFGINGVGAVVSISSFVAFIITLSWASRIVSISLKQIYYCFKPAVIASLFMGIGILFLKYVLSHQPIVIPFYYNFILLSLCGLATYVASLFMVERKLLKDLKDLIF